LRSFAPSPATAATVISPEVDKRLLDAARESG